MRDLKTSMPEPIPIPEINRKNRNGAAGKLIVLVCVVAAVLIAAGIGAVWFQSTPRYKIGKGIHNLMRELGASGDLMAEKTGIGDLLLSLSEDGGHVSTKINLTAGSLFERTVGVDTECYQDKKKRELSADTSFSMMNYEFGHLKIYADEETFRFSIPELFIENMYIGNENVVEQYNGSSLAGLFGPSPVEDFSIDLFPEAQDRLSMLDWERMGDFAERYAADLEACRDSMILEKVERGVYRVVLPAQETERLLRDFMDADRLWDSANRLQDSTDRLRDSADRPQDSANRMFDSVDKLLGSDISLLFGINRLHQIERIAFEEPVLLFDQAVSVKGLLSFQRATGRLEKTQGEFSFTGDERIERTLRFERVRLGEDEESEYAVAVDADFSPWSVHMEADLGNQYDTDGGAAAGSLSLWNEEEDLELKLEGSLDEIVKGQRLGMEVEKLVFCSGGREVFTVTGEISLETFEGEVRSTVGKETAFFEMTEKDWLKLLYKIGDAYGGLPKALW